MEVVKTFSTSEAYKKRDGKTATITMNCTLFNNGDFTIHNENDNPNFEFKGRYPDGVDEVTAKFYCGNILAQKVSDYIDRNKAQFNIQ